MCIISDNTHLSLEIQAAHRPLRHLCCSSQRHTLSPRHYQCTLLHCPQQYSVHQPNGYYHRRILKIKKVTLGEYPLYLEIFSLIILTSYLSMFTPDTYIEAVRTIVCRTVLVSITGQKRCLCSNTVQAVKEYRTSSCSKFIGIICACTCNSINLKH